jgi:protocatechuate 3,4-dioxygenase beta subunit
MGRLNNMLAGVLLLTSIITVAPLSTAAAATSPPSPDCVPNASAPPADPPVGTGSNSISGIVGVAGGDTLEGVTVYAQDINYSFFYTTTTDVAGVYTFAGLEDGNWLVSLAPDEFAGRWYCNASQEWEATVVSVDGTAPDVNDVDILVGPGIISGYVTSLGDPSPLAVAGAVLDIIDDNYESRGVATTDSNGYYEISGIHEGAYRLRLQTANGPESWFEGTDAENTTPIVIEPANLMPSADFQLDAGGLDGTITFAGSPWKYSGLRVQSVSDPVSVSTQTDENGNFTARYLPAGDYFIEAYIGDGSRRLNPDVTSDGLTVQLGLEYAVSTGSIEGMVDRDGEPVDGDMESWGVRAVSVDQTFSAESMLMGGGAYTIDFLPDGDYYLEVTSYETGLVTWYPSASDQAGASIITVSGGGAAVGINVEIPIGPSISGRVFDDDNNPIVGASVIAWQESWWEVAYANTDTNGDYSLEVQDGTYRISVQPQGGFPTWSGGTSYDTATEIAVSGAVNVPETNFTLTRSGFSGTLTNSDGPVAFSSVRVYDVTADLTSGSSAYTNTDEFGAFAFEFLPAGTYNVLAQDSASGAEIGLGTADSDGVTIVTGLTFVLPSAVVSGTISRSGAPIDGNVASTYVELRDATSGNSRSTYADEFGQYHFMSVADGDYYVLATAQDVYGASETFHPGSPDKAGASIVTVVGSDVADVNVTLPGTGIITGTVLDSTGDPIQGFVALYGLDANSRSYNGGDSTNSSGVYSISVIEGDYTVSIGYNGLNFFAPGTLDPDAIDVISVAAGATEIENIDIPVPSTITGTVTDSNGQPVQYVSVQNEKLDFFYYSPTVVAITDALGRYTTEPLYDLKVRLAFVPDGASGLATTYYPSAPSRYGAAQVSLPPGSALEGYDVQLGAPGVIAGTITGIDGNSTRAVVRAWDAATEFGGGAPQSAQLIETLDGVYSFTGLPPGDWIISASPWYDELVPFAVTYNGDQIDWNSATVTTLAPGGSETVDIRSQVGQTISGTVTGPDGVGLAGAVVNASGFGADPRIEWRQTYTDPDGSYVLTGLAPGEVRLYAGLPTNAPWILGEYYPDVYGEDGVVPVAIPATGTIPDIDIQLERSISGDFVISDDSGAIAPSFGFNAPFPVVCPAPTVPEDSFSCSNNTIARYASPGSAAHHPASLPPGTYNVAVRTPRGQLGTMTSFTAAIGDRVDCNLAAPGSSVVSSCSVTSETAGAMIEGMVTDPEGQPQPGVAVTLYETQYGHVSAGGYTADDGRYTVANVPPGTYRLRFENPYRIGRTERSLIEWWSATGDAYEGDYLLGNEIVIAGLQAITGIDVQLDLPASGTVQIGDGTPIADSFVLFCLAPSSFDPTTGRCEGGSSEAREAIDGVATFEYLLPGDYEVVAVTGSFFFGLAPISDVISITLPASNTFDCVLPSIGNGAPTCGITPIVIVDDDDGVSSEDEAGAPNNGDGNADGTPDNQQNSVASVEDPSIANPDDTGSNYVTISATTDISGGGSGPAPLTNVTLIEPTTAPPPGATPQSSLLGFQATGLLPGGTVTLRIYLPQSANSYYKLVDGNWVDATSLATFDVDPTVHGGVQRWGVTLRIVDGGFGDDDDVSGSVTDPGFFAKTERIAPTITIVGVEPGQVFVVGDLIAPECVTTDDDSGVATAASLEVTEIGTDPPDGVGGFLATCSGAVDSAGNVAADVSLTYDVRYSTVDGFFTNGSAAVSPAVNLGKAGRTYPLQWTLASADGSLVTDIDAVTNWSVFDVSCEFITGETEQLPSSISTESSSLSVSAGGQFKLNYKTTKSPGCRIILIKLIDGGSAFARFDLR